MYVGRRNDSFAVTAAYSASLDSIWPNHRLLKMSLYSSSLGSLLAGGFVAVLYVACLYLATASDLTFHGSLSGIVAMQVFLYYRLYPHDRVRIKFTVGSLMKSTIGHLWQGSDRLSFQVALVWQVSSSELSDHF